MGAGKLVVMALEVETPPGKAPEKAFKSKYRLVATVDLTGTLGNVVDLIEAQVGGRERGREPPGPIDPRRPQLLCYHLLN